MVRCICRNCEESFLRKKTRQFCSTACFHAWSRGRINRGPKSYEHRKKLAVAQRGISRGPKSLEMRAKISGTNHYAWVADREALRKKQRIAHGMRKMLSRVLLRTRSKKEGRTLDVLGYTPFELQQHIEKQFVEGMNWNNWGKGPGKWNIDHIRQIALWPTSSSPAEVNALSNLRPLWSEENLSRSRKEALQ